LIPGSAAFAELFGMSGKDHIARVWDIIEKVGVCMLTTQFAAGLRAWFETRAKARSSP
jgi:hypothetical protein